MLIPQVILGLRVWPVHISLKTRPYVLGTSRAPRDRYFDSTELLVATISPPGEMLQSKESWGFHGDFMGIWRIWDVKKAHFDSRPYFEPAHPAPAATPAHPPTGWRPPDRPRAAAAPRSPAGRGATPSRCDPRCAPGREEFSRCRGGNIYITTIFNR